MIGTKAIAAAGAKTVATVGTKAIVVAGTKAVVGVGAKTAIAVGTKAAIAAGAKTVVAAGVKGVAVKIAGASFMTFGGFGLAAIATVIIVKALTSKSNTKLDADLKNGKFSAEVDSKDPQPIINNITNNYYYYFSHPKDDGKK